MSRHHTRTLRVWPAVVLALTAFCLSALAVAGPAGAATGDLAWPRIYNGTGNDDDYYSGAAPAPGGGVYVAGSSRTLHAATASIDYDLLVARYAANGQRQWLRTLNGPGKAQDFVRAVASDSLGNVVVAGNVDYLALTPQVAVVAKYGPQGQSRWARYYDDPNGSYEQATHVAMDGAGNVYVVGEVSRSASGNDVFLMKYSPAGVRKWVRRYTGPGNGQDRINDIAVDGYGNVYLTGLSYSASTDFDILTLKYTPGGKRSWARRVDGPASSSDYGNGIAVTATGTVYVGGETVGTTSGVDTTMVKYASGGAFRWQRTFTSYGAYNDSYTDVTLMGNGDVVGTGRWDSGDPGHDSQVLLARLSPAGAVRWSGAYAGPDQMDDEGHSVARGPGGAVYVSATTTTSTTALDILTLKYSGGGQFAWARTHSGAGSGNDFDAGIVALAGGIYTAGQQQTAGGSGDAVLLKYRP